jgi:hypothetical protein
MHERGIPAMGVWAQVPHYISSMSYPGASVALLDGLREATGLVIDAATLRSEVLIQRRRLDALVGNNDEHRSMVEQLERIYDAGTGTGTGTDVMPQAPSPTSSLEIASADEIAAEVEEFLRGQD